MITLTQRDLSRLFPHAKKAVLATINEQLSQNGINKTKDRLCFFLAQIGHESSGLTIKEENLRYTAKRLTQVWPSRFPTTEAAKAYANNPQALAEKTYGGRMGNSSKGDGWKYRGRGAVQITGKEEYAKVGKAAGLDLVKNPDLVFSDENYIKVACAYWTLNGFNKYADKGNFISLTRAINGGLIGLAERRAWLAKVRTVVDAYEGQEACDHPLRGSRTLKSAVGTGTVGVGLVSENVADVSTQISSAQDHLNAGTIIGLIVGVVLIGLAAWAAYAKWDDAGRPKLW